MTWKCNRPNKLKLFIQSASCLFGPVLSWRKATSELNFAVVLTEISIYVDIKKKRYSLAFKSIYPLLSNYLSLFLGEAFPLMLLRSSNAIHTLLECIKTWSNCVRQRASIFGRRQIGIPRKYLWGAYRN